MQPPPGLAQPPAWEYLILDETTYRNNVGASFPALLMRQTRDQLIAQEQRGLFT